ncbi:restriction endonuclease subunit S [Salinivibrio kushneri]|uniref:Type I restriction modification DNA specificity domain-containing protein n=1 Tax=Salinivibrio kushneri TaxID=1908198 RepID=A0AB36KB78_9GAMM|nr:restriction endonuclease subunit S [Salinivibrio kushneri]OOE45308.1 hypothetical protein BZG09_05030 [Salinivibrio kushneri]
MNWVESTVGEYCPFVYGKSLPKAKRNEGNRPVYGSNGQVDYHDEYYVQGPGIIIGRKGSVGAIHLSEEPFWPIDTTFYVIKESIGELWFTYYLLKSLGLEGMNSDSAVPGLNRDNAHALPIRIPEHATDREQLGNELALFDRKISLNTQTNQTLEAMAQAIFKSWFVDFDPVKAKMQGKQPEGMDADTAALFPDKLVESELGLIPEGWEASLMGEHFNITMGQSPKGETYNERGEGIAFFQGRRDFGFRYPSVRVYTTDPKRFAKSGDTLISVRAPVGDKNMAAIDCCIGRGIAAIRHKSNSRSFTYAFMSHVEKNLDDSGSSGTVFSSINQKELKKVSFVAPPQELIEAFHKTVDPIDQNVEALSGEIESLSLLRDTLLPKLLSGELPLEQAEKLAEVS